MKQAWQRISAREQRLLLAMAMVLLVFAGYSLIWQPSRLRLESTERYYQQQLGLRTQLQHAQPRSIVAGATDQPLSLRVSDGATAAGLDIHQMDSDNELLRLTISGNPEGLLQWLDSVERGGVALQSLSLEKRDNVLEARVVLR
ncbi:type II secretion system protein GspM [Pseudomonas violetae]|jgi:general secretion pathway protein M|uniref:Type II secretion system protein M n=1 Tax=Pseudomonas violetae TaxID=2915813 RepID=A0ABT0F4Q8_9PSED|nr:type II secretion system protein GspM [Pseudomonas violetae]MCK1792943.1 type II secretion system protein M [Pseudomonas violetae]